MLPWSVCVAFKTPVQELWAALTTGINSKALCSLQSDYRNTAGVSVHCFQDSCAGVMGGM